MRAILATIALAASCSFAAAQTTPECQVPVEAALAEVGKQGPIRHTIKLDALQAARVVAWMNAQEPVTDFVFNLVILVDHTNHYDLVFGNDGKVCSIDPISPDMIPTLTDVILGGKPA